MSKWFLPTGFLEMSLEFAVHRLPTSPLSPFALEEAAHTSQLGPAEEIAAVAADTTYSRRCGCSGDALAAPIVDAAAGSTCYSIASFLAAVSRLPIDLLVGGH